MEKTTVEVPERFYFHGNEVDNFIYIQIPKPLIKDKVFGSISDSAKVFYSLLLNRTGLSRKNSWVDENGRIYINYSIQNVVDEFDVGVAKAKSLFAELTDINGTGIGLIKKVRVAGAPSRIYVMNVKGVMNRLRELAQDEAYTDCSGTLEYYAQAESHSAADPMNPYYFRGDEADFFTYVPLPVQLVKNKVFRGMTASAKMLYALLLNRSGDPMHAKKDNEGRVYVNYSIKDLEEQFGVQNRKAIMLFKELTDINGTGIGLIKRVRTANKPCRIYVMNFTQVYEYLAGSADEEIYESEPGADGCAQNRPKDVHKIDRRMCTKSTEGRA